MNLIRGNFGGTPVQLVVFYIIQGQSGYVVWTMIVQALFRASIGQVMTIAESIAWMLVREIIKGST